MIMGRVAGSARVEDGDVYRSAKLDPVKGKDDNPVWF